MRTKKQREEKAHIRRETQRNHGPLSADQPQKNEELMKLRAAKEKICGEAQRNIEQLSADQLQKNEDLSDLSERSYVLDLFSKYKLESLVDILEPTTDYNKTLDVCLSNVPNLR